jgi:hypothetical protein
LRCSLPLTHRNRRAELRKPSSWLSLYAPPVQSRRSPSWANSPTYIVYHFFISSILKTTNDL